MVKRPFWWYKCNACHKNIQKIYPDTISYGTPFYCRFCKVEHFPSIWFGEELSNDVPFPLDENMPENLRED